MDHEKQGGVGVGKVSVGLRFVTATRARVVAARVRAFLGRFGSAAVVVDAEGPAVVVDTDRDGANALWVGIVSGERLESAVAL